MFANRGKNFYILFLTNLLILMIIILLIAVLLYGNIIHKVESDIGESHIETLEQAKFSVDNFILKGIDLLTIDSQIAHNSNDILSFAYKPVEGNMYEAVNISRDIKRAKENSIYIHSIEIFYRDKDIVLSSNYGVRKLDSYHRMFFDNIIPYDQLSNLKGNSGWLETRVIGKSINFKGENVISFVRTIPISADASEAKGFIIVNIDEKPLHATLKEINKSTDKNSFIINTEGNIISHNDKNKLYSDIRDRSYVKKVLSSTQKSGYFIDGWDFDDKALVAYTVSRLNEWIYVSETPVSTFYKNYHAYSMIIVYISIFCLILGILLIYFASVKIYSPITKITESVRRILTSDSNHASVKKKSVDDYKLISETLLGLSKQVTTLNNFVSTNMSFAQSGFIKEFFDGKINNAANIKAIFEGFGVDLKYENYFTIGVFLEDDEQANSLSSGDNGGVMSDEMVHKLAGTIQYYFDGFCIDSSKEKKYVIYIVTVSDPRLPDHKFFQNVLKTLNNDLGDRVTFTVGGICKEILHLYSSYKEVFEAYKYKYIYGKGSVIYYDDVKNRESHDILDINSICHDINKDIKVENIVDVYSVLDDLAQRIRDEKYSYEIVKNYCVYIVIELNNTIRYLDIEMSVIFGRGTNILIEYYCIETIDEYFLWLKQLCKKIVEALQARRGDRNKVLINEIIEFIKMNIENVSLESVAEEFSLSYSYLSRLFKENTGENFNKYIFCMKIEKSVKLLCETDISVEELAESIGYNSKYFIKKFKEIYGQTPYQYRQNLNMQVSKSKIIQDSDR